MLVNDAKKHSLLADFFNLEKEVEAVHKCS